ncbi:sensor histidine kinase [Phycisphaera mikurensis]|uniref:histidine kinase n=1 Tax=Phycisphaera mikurensis (strain NBRC 102666 / KCTC 22515 / FYK2301M01) TaxID=1142394 RepID=I0IE43_PHYMF|nr:PAS domain-containing sensor histidine kinase [Phycisphaera mikurensis]MBB6441336.1 signal transduction histidine kinase [Phycisphaera mikurensis]BAM03531.1 putative two-component system sensor histidine kinase [Phycisphaera mikurensis NBRC 102666]
MHDADAEPIRGTAEPMEARLARLERAQSELAARVAARDAAASLRADVSRRRLRKREADLEAAGGGSWSWRPQTGDPRFSPACRRVLGPGRRGLAAGRGPILADPDASPPRVRDTRELCLARLHPLDVEAFETELNAFLLGGGDRFHRCVRVRNHNGRWIRVIVAAGATAASSDGRVSRVAGLILLLPVSPEAARGSGGADADREPEALAALSSLAEHDLRSPLRTIIGFSEHLDGLVVGDSDAADAVARIRRAGARMATLVDRVDVFASLARGRRRDGVVDLAEVAAEAVLRLENEAEAAGAEVHVHELPIVCGDRVMLLHVFEQLIDNAIRHGKHEPAVVNIDAESAGESVRIHVTDSGAGFDPAMAEAMFEPFVSLRAREGVGPGGGLGLSIARRAVERHGGTIVAEPAPAGTGSRFVITLPIRPAAAAADAG